MRPYEYGFVLACFGLLACHFFFPRHRTLALLFAGFVVGCFCLHAHSQNLRLSLLGAYLSGLALLIVTIRPLINRATKMLFGIFTLVALGFTAVTSATHAPSATGPYLVGISVPDWRMFTQTPAHLAPVVELWYPVNRDAPHSSRSAKALSSIVRFFQTGETGLPEDPILNAPIAKSNRQFPLLLYFSGGSGEAIDNIYLIDELVSHGFVVASVHYPLALPGVSSEDLYRRSVELARPWDFSGEQAFKATSEWLTERVQRRAKDASSVLNVISGLNASDLSGLKESIDISRVGIFGFSFGGAIAAEAKLRDERFRAAINFDGWHFGEAVEHGVSSPYLYVITDDTVMPSIQQLTSSKSEERYGAILNKREFERPIAAMRVHGGSLLTIMGARHANLTDKAFRCFLLRRIPLGPIDPNEAFLIISSYTLVFFQAYLQGRPSEILDPATQYFIEANLKIWRKKDTAIRQGASY